MIKSCYYNINAKTFYFLAFCKDKEIADSYTESTLAFMQVTTVGNN